MVGLFPARAGMNRQIVKPALELAQHIEHLAVLDFDRNHRAILESSAGNALNLPDAGRMTATRGIMGSPLPALHPIHPSAPCRAS